MVKNNTRSYTLIEILIVTTIILVLSGTSLALFYSFRDDKALTAQVSILTHVFELAKTKASAGDVSLCGSNPTPYLDSYSVVVNSSTTTLLPGCINTAPTPQSYTIPSNIVYVTPTFSVRFDGQNYQGGTRRFPIKNTYTNKCKFVQIDETGNITNGDCSTCLCP